MVKRSKKYREAAERVDRNNLYTANEAIALLKSMPSYNFDQTVEAVFRLSVDPRKADQLVRGTVNLPHGTGKTAKVLVFARGPKATEATEAGADIVGDDDLIAKVQGGFLDFDAVVATPDMMGKVGRLGRVLGPRGLMPNPKTGTVTMDVTKAVKDIKGGKIEFRVDKNGNLSFLIGKMSFDDGSFCFFPVLVATDVFFAVHLVTQGNLCLEVLEVHRFEHDGDNVHDTEELILHLVRTAEDMRIILCKATYTS